MNTNSMTIGSPIKLGLSSTASPSSAFATGMSASDALAQKSFTDISALQNLKALGKTDQGKAIEQVAKQFESIFIQQMLKSMRQAGDVLSKGGLFDSNEMKFHRDMLDQQLGLSMTQGKGLGLAESIARQLKRQYGLDKVEGELKPLRPELAIDIKRPDRITAKPAVKQSIEVKNDSIPNHKSADHCSVVSHLDDKTSTLSKVPERNYVEAVPGKDISGATKVKPPTTPAEFVAQILPYAKEAAESLGVDYKVLLAQSALESGWGKSNNGNNLFGIKASANWQGDKSSAKTVEYIQGEIQRPVEDFRAYNSHQASFIDYADLIKSVSRYDAAVGEKDPKKYIAALHSAGYATDPNYVKKVMSVYNSESMRHAIAHAEHRGEGND